MDIKKYLAKINKAVTEIDDVDNRLESLSKLVKNIKLFMKIKTTHLKQFNYFLFSIN